MLISKAKYDELNARNIELARQVRDLSIDNKELREIRKETEHNNTILEKSNRELTETVKEIYKLATSNTYNNNKIILNKIKELARPSHQN